MHEKKLALWITQRLLVFAFAGFTIFLYGQFQIYRNAERSTTRLRLRQQADMAWEIISHRPLDFLDSPAMCNALCQRLALITQTRVTLVGDDGFVRGDSVFGASFRLDTNAQPQVFAVYHDPVRDRRIMSYVTRRPGPGSQPPILLRLSTPIPDALDIGQSVLTDAFGYILLALAVIVIGALLIARTVTRQINRITSSIDRYKLGHEGYELEFSEFAELRCLADAIVTMAGYLRMNRTELTHQTNRWEAIITNMREGILALDHESRISIINPAALRYFAVNSSNDAIGKLLVEVIRNTDLNAFIKKLEHDRFQTTELDYEPRLNDTRTYQLGGLRMEFNSEAPSGYLLVFNDITKLRKLERMRKEFVANVSHELKTPITTITGLLEYMPVCIRTDRDQALSFLRTIVKNTERLTMIIDDLLYLSRLEHGDKQALGHFIRENIRKTIDCAVASAEQRARRKAIRFTCTVPDCLVYANHRLLEQAFGNLIGNAIKFSPKESEVEISAREESDELVIQFKDRGIGIPGDHQTRIFQRFYRVDPSRDRGTGGTGLGLAIVKHIIQAHRGSVAVVSEVGAGSSFIICLPLGPEPSEPIDG